ncbi:hypothetical protein LPU83_pLPU83b_0188 (plasmid) [Rhizobium favelukesii]|uniref:Uncharacterized protein n=1 Tax=Rhizobium favelukesii TaxID=348824 RepID=W6RMM8_9HYPH|nr:hypothetical protein LPU83_pLPU83b_0188 [Rhizobium favelukesii]
MSGTDVHSRGRRGDFRLLCCGDRGSEKLPGKICRETKVATHPEDLISVIKDPKWQIEWIGS